MPDLFCFGRLKLVEPKVTACFGERFQLEKWSFESQAALPAD